MITGFSPYGLGPWGVDDSGGIDLSTLDTETRLQQDPTSLKTFLFIGKPYDYSLGARVEILLSDSGYASGGSDTLPDGTPFTHKLFRAGLTSPYNWQSRVMSNGQLSGDVPSQLDLIFEIATGRFKSYLGLNWDNAVCQIYCGRPEWPLHDFVEVFHGVSGAIQQSDTMEAHLPLADNSYQLRRPVQQRAYTGMGAALRGDGSTTMGSATIAKPSSDLTMEAWIRPKTSASTVKIIAGWQHGADPGNALLRFDIGVVNRLQFSVRDDAGTRIDANYDGLPALIRAHIAGVIDTPAHNIRLVLNGVTVATTPTGTSTFVTAQTDFKILRRPDTAVAYFDGDIDDYRLWSVARSDSDIIADKDREIPSDTPGLVQYLKFNEGTGSTAFDSTVGAHNVTITGAVQWTSSLEGGVELAGQFPPVWEGVARQVQPVSVDSQNNVWEISRGPSAVSVSDASDEGAQTIVVDGTIIDPYDWTPVPGHCIVSYMDGRTLLRLESAPIGTLTVTITSDTTDTANIIKKYAKAYGGWTDDKLDLPAFAIYASSRPQPVRSGRRSPSKDDTLWSLMVELARADNGWLTMTRSGLLTIGRLIDPATVAPRFKLTSNDVGDGVKKIDISLAVKSTKLGYRIYETVQVPANLATSLTDSQKLDLGQQYRYVQTPVDSSITAVRDNALDGLELTLYDLESDAYTEAVARQGLRSVDRATYELPLTRGIFKFSMGDVIECTLLAEDGSYVENLNATRLIVMSVVEDSKLLTNTLEAWGEIPVIPTVFATPARATDDGSVRVTDDYIVRVID